MFYQSVKHIQIENSSICNAACPMCLREMYPDKSWFKQTYLELDFFKNNIPSNIYQNLESILFCGAIGDPMSATNIVEVCEYIKTTYPHIKITINTNGGLRSTKVWKDLAKVLDRDDIVIFSIDGLADTNHIYRRNVNWNALIDNVKAFIDNGGTAWWQYIVFKHNQHQVEEAKSFSKALGFTHFFHQASMRFVTERALSKEIKIIEHDILETDDPNYIIDGTYNLNITLDEYISQYKDAEIDCVAIKEQSAYIDYAGRLFPCCAIATSEKKYEGLKKIDVWDAVWNNHGKNKLSLYKYNFEDIIASDFYRKIKEGWNKQFCNGKLFTCTSTCSKKLSMKHHFSS